MTRSFQQKLANVLQKSNTTNTLNTPLLNIIENTENPFFNINNNIS